MTSFAPQIAYYLERYRRGQTDDALHGLLELDHAVLPELSEEFRASTDTGIRAFLLHVIWQHRRESVVPVLSEALLDREPRVWREAIDGLVTLASPASIQALHAARGKREEEDFSRWLEEAIEQGEAESQK